MKVWTVANQKGGVGKTTTTVSLGGLLAAWGFRTLMIDVDPHGSLTSYFGLDPDSLDRSSYSLFEAVAERRELDPSTLLVDTGTEGLSLLPAAIALATLDRQSGRLEGMGLVIKHLSPHYSAAELSAYRNVVGMVPSIVALWLTPAMDGLFTGPAADRRRFLDRLTVALEPGHAAQSSRFEKLMRQRNKLLDDDMPDARWLDAVETEMAGAAVAVSAARRETVMRLSATQAERGGDDLFPAFSIVIEGELEAALEGASATAVEDHYREQLAAMRRQDGAAGRTLSGPHRSDLAVTHLGKNIAAALASTGEQKALLIGLTLAHADIVSRAEGRNRPPILLLDEIAAHLDDLRRAALYERLLDLNCQAWMTGTDRALFSAISDAAQPFEVAGGGVQPWD